MPHEKSTGAKQNGKGDPRDEQIKTELAELASLARAVDAYVTEARYYAAPTEGMRRDLARHGRDVAAERRRCLQRLRAMVLAARDLADDGVPPRMLFAEGVFFYARCEQIDARRDALRVGVDGGNVERLERAQRLIDRIAVYYPTIARGMNLVRVADAIGNATRQRGKWRAIHAAWPGSATTHPDVDGWRADWSDWKRRHAK